MSRQNCKNCGEPYTFDNLVTPGRATKICGACQRKIYVHTGQICFEVPSSIQPDKSIKIPMGQGIAVLHDAQALKESREAASQTVPLSAPAPAQGPRVIQNDLPASGWKRANYTKKAETQKIVAEVLPTDLEKDAAEADVALGAKENLVLFLLYVFCFLWIAIAVFRLYLLLQGSVSTLEVWLPVVSAAFYSLVAAAIAEGLKTLWKQTD